MDISYGQKIRTKGSAATPDYSPQRDQYVQLRINIGKSRPLNITKLLTSLTSSCQVTAGKSMTLAIYLVA